MSRLTPDEIRRGLALSLNRKLDALQGARPARPVEPHTAEPWRLGRRGTVVANTCPADGLVGRDDLSFLGGYLIAESVSPPDARRIVACVNACAGVPTESLEAAALRDGLEDP